MKRLTTPDPVVEAERFHDGRNIDPVVGTLAGEGALQRVTRRPEPPMERWTETPGELGPSYHGVPMLKEPVWSWDIPAYVAVGGLAGACGVLGATAQALGGRGARDLVWRCRAVGTAGAVVSAALLIHDLGRPARFLNMLRVFRPTSPMNMGTWVLSSFGACTALATLPAVVDLPRPLARAAEWAGYGAGVLGLPLVGYTGVLLSSTAVPVWQETRRTLPVLVAFSGAVSAAGLFQVWQPRGAGYEMARRFGGLAKGAEAMFSILLHREAGRVPRVERALRRGKAGLLLRAGRVLTGASLVLDVLGHRGRWHRTSGALALAGTLALRFGIVAAGRASARDPFATIAQQRSGHGAAELVRKDEAPARPGMPSLPGLDATGKETAGLEQPSP